MKKVLALMIVISVVSCSKKEVKVDYAILSGKIENINGSTLSVRSSEKALKDISVAEDGIFTDTLKNIKAGYYTFRYNNETSGFYLKPGDNLNLSLDTKEFDESILYTGVGSNENNYLAQKFLKDEGLGKLSTYQYLGTVDESTYVSIIDSIKNLESNFLNEQKDIDSEFRNLEEASIKYDWVNKMDRYVLYRRYVTEEKDFEVSENYPDYQQGLNLEDETLLGLRNYIAYLISYYNKKAKELALQENSAIDITYLKVLAKEVEPPTIKEKLLYGAARSGISYTSSLQDYYDVFMSNSIDDVHKKDITEKYNKLIKLSKGQPSPKFVNYENYNGGTTSLDDLKGKYVYIDVWATWCGPCIREIPSLKEVEKNYHGKNIAFVSLSIDAKNDHDKWKDMIKEKELGGIQLFADNSGTSQFVTDYEIHGIPRFILIDPEGNIVNSNAPRPSSPELISLFDELQI